MEKGFSAAYLQAGLRIAALATTPTWKAKASLYTSHKCVGESGRQLRRGLALQPPDARSYRHVPAHECAAGQRGAG